LLNPVKSVRNFQQWGGGAMNFPEPLVARSTGVNRERVAAARKASLVKGDDWTLENSVVCYSAEGLKKLLGALGLAEGAFAWPRAACEGGDPKATPLRGEPDVKKSVEVVAAAEAARPVVDLKVAALSRNPTIIEAVGPDARRVSVRVRSNVNFLPGMALKAREPAPGASLYHFEGQCPRWKGRY
jgi:hypothetical protein